jgi:hypothetical protein
MKHVTVEKIVVRTLKITKLSKIRRMRIMFQYERNNTFVCLDEITNQPEEPNPVIYNPNKDNIAYRTELLYRTILEGTGHELTSEQLIHLTKYEAPEIPTFINELKKIIYA